MAKGTFGRNLYLFFDVNFLNRENIWDFGSIQTWKSVTNFLEFNLRKKEKNLTN